MARLNVYAGDCYEVLQNISDNSFDSIVTDPPYGIALMGHRWDYDVPAVKIWQECLRVLKPGGMALVFASTRTYHRAVVNLEDAGFSIRDMISWVYSSGFPKTTDLSTAVAKRDPERAAYVQGLGTALKPALEPICLARKPLAGTLTDNVLRWGTGALHIDACRVPGDSPSVARRKSAQKSGVTPGRPGEYKHTISDRTTPERYMAEREGERLGRFPANLLHDGSPDITDCLSGNTRCFYAAKAGPRDRAGSSHPAVKPLSLMAYLCRLITPAGGHILDPFAGSGTTAEAALDHGFCCSLVERDASYVAELRKRFEYRIIFHGDVMFA